MDRDISNHYKDHLHLHHAAGFCEKYDQNAFDANYDTMPFEAFEPMVMKLFEAPKNSIYADAAAKE